MTDSTLYPPLTWRIGGTPAPATVGGIGSDPEVNGRELLGIITSAIAGAPRSQQRRIGPSELGIPCTFCLAHKIAGVEEIRTGGDWLPAIGTAVHSWLDGVFGEEDAAADLASVQAGGSANPRSTSATWTAHPSPATPTFTTPSPPK
jgi:hypothetical protein